MSILQEAGFWYAVSFVLFFVIFGPKVWKPLAGLLDARAERIRLELEESARLRREAEQMREDAMREREQAFAEANAVVEQAKKQAEDLANKARLDAEEMLRRREQMAQDRIAAAERAAVEVIRAAAVDAAFDAAHAIMSKTVMADTLVDQAISDLPVALNARAA